MRVLLVVFSRAGHLNPMIAVAQELELAGHEVTLFGLDADVSAVAARAGLRAQTATSATTSTAASEPRASLRLAARANDVAWAKRFHTIVLLDPVKTQVEQLARLVQERRPDVIGIDPLAYAAAVVAERARVPWACLATGLQSLEVDGRRAADAPAFDQLASRRSTLLGSLGVDLAFRSCDVVSPYANMVFAYAGLFPRGAPAGLDCIGPALPRVPRGDEPPFDWSRIPRDRPLVFVSFGSQLSHVPEVYQAVWSSLSADEACVVTTLKDLLHEPFARTRPEHVIAVDYAPQLAMLERAAAMVTHGGANSVMEALRHGCPMLVIPIASDQPLLGYLVAQAGAGAALDPAAITPEACREQLLPLLDSAASARTAARAIGDPQAQGSRNAAARLVALGGEV